MKMKTLIIALVFVPMLNFAIDLDQHHATYPAQQTVEAAKSANKFILVISQSHAGRTTGILENKHTSRFLQEHFVIEQQTNPRGLDEYHVYNQQRTLLHRVADEPYPYELAVKIKRALDPNTQYYTLLSRFENGERSVALLENLIIGAYDAADCENAPRLMQAYLDSQASPVTAESIRLLARYTKATSDPGFSVLLDNIAAADDVLGKGKTAEKLAAIIFEEAFVPHRDDEKLDLAALTAQVTAAYPNEHLVPAIARMPIELLEMREDWESLGLALPVYLHAHGAQLSKAARDYYVWLTGEYLITQ